MRNLDLHWRSNPDWWEIDDEYLIPVLKKDAPAEAQESYQRYLQQKKQEA